MLRPACVQAHTVTACNLCLVWRVLNDRWTRVCQQVSASRPLLLLLQPCLPVSLLLPSCIFPHPAVLSTWYYFIDVNQSLPLWRNPPPRTLRSPHMSLSRTIWSSGAVGCVYLFEMITFEPNDFRPRCLAWWFFTLIYLLEGHVQWWKSVVEVRCHRWKMFLLG